MTIFEQMSAGHHYDASDPDLLALRQEARQHMQAFNQELDVTKRTDLLKTWLGKTGENCLIETGFSCDYGKNIFLGENFFANFNCTFLDVCPITIGDDAMIGPNVQFLTPLHPLDADERVTGVEYGKPITIGDKVWIGGGATILAGVTLGNRVVIGAGSVVTKSFDEDNIVLAGNPARVIKRLT
ncbi:sugar O-acetyltransferase [Streptococcus sp. E17BB]|uniref:sugar O-acetyltransferase n=1 Tax=Streptococcus sp. E17BB TaxID=3278714 RepID=UPI00359D534A